MLKDLLIKLFGEEQGTEMFNKLQGHKEAEILVNDKKNPKYIDIQKYNDAETTTKDYKKQLGDRDKQLESLQKKVKDNEELSNEIQKLKDDNTKITKDFEDKLNKQSFDYALDRALTGAKARNATAVKALLNIENIKLDGDNLLGLKEQLEALKTKEPYLFGEETAEQEHQGGTGSISGTSDGGDKVLSLGETLAQQATVMKTSTEAQDKFFS